MASIIAFLYSSSPSQILIFSLLVVHMEKSKTTPFSAGIFDSGFLHNSFHSNEAET